MISPSSDHKIDPLLTAMLARLTEMNPGWRDDEADRWCQLFEASVRLLYPCKPKRKSRAKKPD